MRISLISSTKGILVFLLLFQSAGATQVKKLPTIELPEYVITGVERATLIPGERMRSSSMINPEITIPEPQEYTRPQVSSVSVSLPLVRPQTANEAKYSFRELSVYGGSFTSIGAHAKHGWSFPVARLVAEIHADKAPRRIDTGEVYCLKAGSGVIGKLNNQALVSADVSASRSEFELNYSGDTRRSVGNISVSANISPFENILGLTSGRISVAPWFLSKNADINGIQSELIFHNSRNISSGRLNVELGFSAENLEQDNVKLSLFNGVVSYGWLQEKHLNLELGMLVQSGTSPQNSSFIQVYPRFEANWDPGFTGFFSAAYTPGHSLVSTREIFDCWYMLDDVSRGSLTEHINRIEIAYNTWIGEDFSFSLSSGFESSLHDPVPVSAGGSWKTQTVSTNSTRIKLDGSYRSSDRWETGCYLLIEDSKSDYNNQAVSTPLKAPAAAGAWSEYRFNKWLVRNEISWFDLTPVGLHTAFKRPAHFEVNLRIQYEIKHNLALVLEGFNLLDEHYGILPAYDAAPFTVKAGLALTLD